jgi:hypothetical protein
MATPGPPKNGVTWRAFIAIMVPFALVVITAFSTLAAGGIKFMEKISDQGLPIRVVALEDETTEMQECLRRLELLNERQRIYLEMLMEANGLPVPYGGDTSSRSPAEQ